jgi:Spy/CpxP family protein refolding chaperone
MKKIEIVVVAVLPLMVFAVINGCRHERHPGAEFMVDYLAEALDLDDAQRRQVDQIRDELMAKGKELKAGHRRATEELKGLVMADTLNQERLKAIVAEHRGRMDELVDLAILRLADFHRTLSAEQKAKLVSKIERFSKMRRSRWVPDSEG